MLKQEYLTVESDLTVLTKVQQWFDRFCFQHNFQRYWSENQLYSLKLALTEGFTNAVRHAHEELPLATPIEIEMTLWDDRLEMRIWDRGEPFNPDALPEPLPGTLQEGGYGWFLLRRLADRVIYERCSDGRNCLCIVKEK
ncbi:ATP-binding protein [Oxynema aestuarii]|jgi:serine/threonine-protein kinase RsbW|uniref:Anti-sigma regulatory factor n=1 Tax=Oxynema aestuarii AP17 TaxID=2064643 RepID=A0A6H1TWE4_9CYAN|nr:anti-sigma regulatory factor [Oxynema aestuarii]QIZ70914.1 anti-sigma regulatory factor [Oxynema aestuarii AP17]RMH78368.1 MAG: anti-sigma regulatory factor [Cyanobacteria bacterium J007]